MNSLYNSMNQQQNPMMQAFKQFQSAFRGDAKTQVQQLLNSGQMTQAQFNQYAQLANNFKNMMR